MGEPKWKRPLNLGGSEIDLRGVRLCLRYLPSRSPHGWAFMLGESSVWDLADGATEEEARARALDWADAVLSDALDAVALAMVAGATSKPGGSLSMPERDSEYIERIARELRARADVGRVTAGREPSASVRERAGVLDAIADLAEVMVAALQTMEAGSDD